MLHASGVHVEALATSETIVPGGEVSISVRAFVPDGTDVAVGPLTPRPAAGWTQAPLAEAPQFQGRGFMARFLREQPTQQASFTVTAATDARLSQPYWLEEPAEGRRVRVEGRCAEALAVRHRPWPTGRTTRHHRRCADRRRPSPCSSASSIRCAASCGVRSKWYRRSPCRSRPDSTSSALTRLRDAATGDGARGQPGAGGHRRRGVARPAAGLDRRRRRARRSRSRRPGRARRPRSP